MTVFKKVLTVLCVCVFASLAANADELFADFQGSADILFGSVYTYSVRVQGEYDSVAWSVTGGQIKEEWWDKARFFCKVKWIENTKDNPAKIKVYGQKKGSDEMFAESLSVNLQSKKRSLGFRSLQNGAGKCLDVDLEGLAENGGKIQIWECNGSVQQRWKIDQLGRLVNASGKCLDIHAPDVKTDGGKVQIWDCADADQQKWTLNKKGRLVNKGGKCLDVHAPDAKTDGGKVQIWACVDAVQQQWKWIDPVAK